MTTIEAPILVAIRILGKTLNSNIKPEHPSTITWINPEDIQKMKNELTLTCGDTPEAQRAAQLIFDQKNLNTDQHSQS